MNWVIPSKPRRDVNKARTKSYKQFKGKIFPGNAHTARKTYQNFYYTGEPCPKEHKSLRLTSDHRCMECLDLYVKENGGGVKDTTFDMIKRYRTILLPFGDN